MTRNTRIGLLLAAVAVAAVAIALASSGGDSSKSSKPTATTPSRTTATSTATTPSTPAPPPVPTIVLRGGKPAGGVKTLEFKSGERARFAVSSDSKQDLHLHGYEIEKTVPAGGRVTFSFKANAQGIYQLESHTTNATIAKVKVVP
jgi:hypothetical protein